ncbi:hypothetical protein llg_14650 [Luteolibacter sp. LG18]|nr:hypothetical protein llg_14650 [Luteolibacter sp. LG18]
MAQDEHGVVFHATDSETGGEVAVRRIFPFGADGGGLNEEQRATYEASIGKFAAVKHAGLRTVVGGGCDPVDGMPFLATEWVEGPTLAQAMERGPIAAASVVALMERALEVCVELSKALQEEETVWIETSPSAIIVSTEDASRGFTFWVGPLKWLNEANGKRGLAPLAKLLRTVLAQPHPDDDPGVLEILQNFSRWLDKYSELAEIPQAQESMKEFFAPLSAGVPRSVPPGPRPVMAARPGATTQPAARPAAPTNRAPAVQTAAPVVKPPGMASAAEPEPTQMGGYPVPVPKKKSLMPLVTIAVAAVCLSAAGYQVYRFQQAKKSKAAATSTADDPTKGLSDSIARAVGNPATKPAETTPPPAPKPEAQKPAPKPAPPKPSPKPEAPKPAPPKPPAAAAIPGNSPILGTWKYFDAASSKACTRTFSNEGGASWCSLKAAGTEVWKCKVTKIAGDDFIVTDPKGTELHHVLAKDGKTLKIEGNFQASK